MRFLFEYFEGDSIEKTFLGGILHTIISSETEKSVQEFTHSFDKY